MIFKERYKQIVRLGKRRFSEVFKVLDIKDGKFYALKFIAKSEEENINDLINNYKKEINIIEKIKSEYVIKIIENFYDETLSSLLYSDGII